VVEFEVVLRSVSHRPEGAGMVAAEMPGVTCVVNESRLFVNEKKSKELKTTPGQES
jgi:hypothetical protein